MYYELKKGLGNNLVRKVNAGFHNIEWQMDKQLVKESLIGFLRK